MKKLALLLASALVFTACQTPTGYVPRTAKGGYWETREGPDEFRVFFGGNEFTPHSRVSDLVLLRAAELTLKHGFQSFEVVSFKDISQRQNYLVPGQSFSSADAFRNGNTVQAYSQTTTMPAHEETVYFPGKAIRVKAYKSKAEGKQFDAQELASELRLKYSLGKPKP